MKVRSRKFDGRCSRHKTYNPAVDGNACGNCHRCGLLFEIWETSLKLNNLIRKFDPNHDDLKRPPQNGPDPRQLTLV